MSFAGTSILTVKPFFQLNNDYEDTHGIELGYWPYKAFPNTDLYLGYDAGLLTSGSNVETYADVQLGSRFVGVGSGAYLIGDSGWHTGLQFNFWVNVFAGVNFRTRYNPWDPMGSSTAFYIAVPLIIQDRDE